MIYLSYLWRVSYCTKNTEVEFPSYWFDLEVLSAVNLDTLCSNLSYVGFFLLLGFDFYF